MKDKQVYVVLIRAEEKVLTYGSAAAMLADAESRVTIDRNRLNYLARGGFPVHVGDVIIHRTRLRRKVKAGIVKPEQPLLNAPLQNAT